MRLKIIAVLAIVFLILASCGNQDESSDQSAESQTTVSAPKVDLHTAVALNKLDAIRLHVDAGSDLNVLEPSRASTPLITAIALGRSEAAQILIDGGANLNYQNNDGSTALHTAAFFCHEDIVRILLEKNADKSIKNNRGRTAYETVSAPFENVKPVYDAIGSALKPAGVVLDYEQIKATRPIIAEMLK